MQYLEGTLGDNQYRNTVRKNWQLIPKYRVENRRNTDTAFMIGHAFLTLYPSRLFLYLKHVHTRNQPQPSRENVRSQVIGCPTNFTNE